MPRDTGERRATARKSTIYDIARAASASPSTVSLVLNGSWTRYRIKDDTAKRILRTADELGYAVNLKARALRLSRSGLAGMIIPHYRNRFFTGMAEAFEAESRRRNLCPIVVSTQHDNAIEASVTETLLSQQVESLFITGVRDPSPLNRLCQAADIPCVNIDLPGELAPSVVSDNRRGAAALTDILIGKLKARAGGPQDLLFLGGFIGEYATDQRIVGFKEALARHGLPPGAGMVDGCGYRPGAAREALARRHAALGRMPGALFINSTTAFEGLVRFAASLGRDALDAVAIGCFDWDPFAAYLPLDVTMMRQNVEAMIAEGFAIVETFDVERRPLVMVPAEFGPSGETDALAEPAG